MKKHLFLVESSNTVNLNEISKLYDTVSVIEFSDNPNEVIAENVKKLEARYPGGSFDVHYSENRKDGDL